MATVKSGISKVGNNYYQSVTSDNPDGSVGTTFARVDAQGNNAVPIYDVDSAAGSSNLVKTFTANATAEEKKLLSDPNSQLSQARSQQITSSNPYGTGTPTAVQQQQLSKAAGGSGNTATPETSGQPAAAAATGTSTETPLTPEEVQSSIGREGVADEGGPDLRYPLRNTYQGDYLFIEMRTYKKSGFQSEPGSLTVTRMEDRKHTPIRNIYLPIQSGIVDSISVDWGQGDINPITAQFAGLALGTITKAGTDKASDVLADFAQNTADIAGRLLGSANPEIQKLVANEFTQRAIGTPGLLSRSIGGAINNNLELLFNGPTLRSFTFNFKLTPREPAEAKVIKEIIRVFKKGMSPSLSKAGLFLGAPNVFKLKYIYTGKGDKKEDHPYLNKIKVAALRDFSVNYTPDGNYMTYGGEVAEGQGSMTQYDLSMTFGEIDPVYAQDYDDDQGKTGMGW
jgi:hypothetical protein